MKRSVIICLLAGIVGYWAGPARTEDGGSAALQNAGSSSSGVEMKMLVLEGIRDRSTPPAKVVTSSFLRYVNYFTQIQSDSEAATEQQIKQVFNLKDARLLSEANLRWERGKSEKAFHIFRLDGREYLILVAPGKQPAPQQFRVEVFEQSENEKASLLDTDFNIPEKNAAVFGFEDTQGKPYFLSFRVLRYARTAGGGIRTLGETHAPRLIKSVDPVYPEVARQARVEGNVILEARTDVYGRVQSVKVLRSIPLLDQAAIDALRQYEYEPAVVDGEPQPVTFTITMRFTLEEGEGVKGGVEGGVVGGVLGGVEGKIKGGIEGGVKGGVAGGVTGGVEGGVEGPTLDEFDKGAVVVKDAIQPPRLVKSVEPVYPEIARQAQVEGIVILAARTDEEGNVEAVKILRSIPLLDQAAMDAVKQWKYEPLAINGKPRKAVFTVTVRFKLVTGDKEKDLEKFAQGAVKAEGELKPPRLIKSVEPVYPKEAQKARVEGIVILSVKTDAKGRVMDAMILRSIPLLNKAALDAVRQWVYEPLVINNVPTPVVFTVTVRFQAPENGKIKKDADGQIS